MALHNWNLLLCVVMVNVVTSHGQCDIRCSGVCTVQGAGKCDATCIAGFGIDYSTYTCQPCDINCSPSYVCNTRGPGKCDSTCKSGFGLTAYYTCAACSPYCSYCSTNGPGKCDSGYCNSGYTLSTSRTCAACGDYCIRCNYHGPGMCDSCQAGFGLNNNFQCERCDPNCRRDYSCDTRGAGKCDSDSYCQSGYRLNANYNCERCLAANCSTCSYSARTCSACLSGYGFDALGNCKPCDVNCDSKYFEYRQNDIFDSRLYLMNGCYTYGSGRCDYSCRVGYGISADHTCERCDEKCSRTSTCNRFGPGKCDTECSAGYGLTASRNCAPCDPHCNPFASCDIYGAGKCDNNCTAGYGVTAEQTCAPCDVKCDPTTACNAFGAGKCDVKCVRGYKLNTAHNCEATTDPDDGSNGGNQSSNTDLVSSGFKEATIALGIIAGVSIMANVLLLAICIITRMSSKGRRAVNNKAPVTNQRQPVERPTIEPPSNNYELRPRKRMELPGNGKKNHKTEFIEEDTYEAPDPALSRQGSCCYEALDIAKL